MKWLTRCTHIRATSDGLQTRQHGIRSRRRAVTDWRWTLCLFRLVAAETTSMLGRQEVQSDLLALESGQSDAHVCGRLGGPALACDVTGAGCACSTFVWTHKRDLVQVYLVQAARTRAEKQRLLECFIMEHQLTDTNTFSTDDEGKLNIYTCNYNGCHEPQQIDYILSSDNSLRSKTFDSSATASHHWGLTATIRAKRGKHLEKACQETYWMGMSRPHRFQQHSACTGECGQWTFCSGAAAQRQSIFCAVHIHRWIRP